MTLDDLMNLADRCYSRFADSVQRWQLRAAIQDAIAEAVVAERERCAKVCMNLYGPKDWYDGNSVSEQCAAAIRKGPQT